MTKLRHVTVTLCIASDWPVLNSGPHIIGCGLLCGCGLSTTYAYANDVKYRIVRVSIGS